MNSGPQRDNRSRLGRLRDGVADFFIGTKNILVNWLYSMTRRKILFYLLVSLFTLGILAAYPLSTVALLSISAAMPIALEITWGITKFITNRIFSSVRGRVNRALGRRADGDDTIGETPDVTDRDNTSDLRTDPGVIINALTSGNNERALQLVANVNVRHTNSLMTLVAETIRRNAIEVFNRLIVLPEVEQRLSHTNNRLLLVAVRERRPEMVTALLRNERVRNNAEISNNEALREACSLGALDIVNALLDCPNVVNRITFNHNEAVRLAQENGHFDVVARLLEIEAVANYQVPENIPLHFTPRTTERLHVPADPLRFNPYAPQNLGVFDLFGVLNNLDRLNRHNVPNRNEDDNALRNFANNRENAMAGLDANQQRELGVLQQRYQAEFQSRGLDAIMAEIRGFLIEKYNANPIRHNGRAIPIDEYNASLPANVKAQYFTHKIHTAYRYLFKHPNPWISQNAIHVQHHMGGGRSASISNDHKIKIAYLWLAASNAQTAAVVAADANPSRRVPQAEAIDSLKTVFAELILAGAARGHNYDNHIANARAGQEVDDGEGDKPTCGMGVSQWVTQFLTLVSNDPASRPLNVDTLRAKFKSILVADENNRDALFTKLERMDKATLTKTKDAMEDYMIVNIGNLDGVEEENRPLIEALKPSADAIEAMVQECKTFFSEQRITAQERVRIGTDYHASYEACLRHWATNLVQDCYQEINHKIEQLQKAPAKKPAGKDSPTRKGKAVDKDNHGKTLTFIPRNQRGKKSSTDKENDSSSANDDSAKPKNKSTKKR
ncbi:ankyrin repeat domain-containing protein [Candidatus Berkiella aquae]|uniref:Ankyrin repeat domain-containing protein n=1 Tax=Candidatus Berkiella aquae TaxID=295108 RepID=A0A0Q9YK54_9GAMM|nr:ankyrin repeat domain-containing protein [Candidatus Berkiella aquae]MCS5709991.1 ankyrin repeat domain-containing protein [Candidatus Berkiella aquae]